MIKLQSVLLVDDDPVNNFLNQKLLEKLQLEIQVAIRLNGQEALSYLKLKNIYNSLPQLILLDIDMPHMNGLEFLEKSSLYRTRPDAPIITIILSNSCFYHDIDCPNSQSNIYGVVEKPLNTRKITKILNRYFQLVEKAA